MNKDQSAGALDDEEVALSSVGALYGKPILVGTTAPPPSSFRREDNALRLADMAADTGKHRRTSASDRISILFESRYRSISRRALVWLL